MKTVEEITQTLTQMSDLLAKFGPKHWADALRACANDYPSDPRGTAAQIRRMYGGMGSLNDIVLYSGDGVPMHEENDTFDALRRKLYEACR